MLENKILKLSCIFNNRLKIEDFIYLSYGGDIKDKINDFENLTEEEMIRRFNYYDIDDYRRKSFIELKNLYQKVKIYCIYDEDYDKLIDDVKLCISCRIKLHELNIINKNKRIEKL